MSREHTRYSGSNLVTVGYPPSTTDAIVAYLTAKTEAERGYRRDIQYCDAVLRESVAIVVAAYGGRQLQGSARSMAAVMTASRKNRQQRAAAWTAYAAAELRAWEQLRETAAAHDLTVMRYLSDERPQQPSDVE